MSYDTSIFDYASKGDMKDHALVMYGIVRGMKPSLVFEIGVRRGDSTMALLLGLKYNGSGKLFSIDIRESKGTTGRAKKRALRLGVDSFWQFECADSMEFWKTWKNPIDILFIDGNHRYPAVKNDFENYSKFVRKNGLIMMHDSFCDEETIARDEVGVQDYINVIKGWPLFELVTLPYCYGLTIVRKLYDK